VQARLQIYLHSSTKIDGVPSITQDNIFKNAVTTALRMERNLNSHQTDVPPIKKTLSQNLWPLIFAIERSAVAKKFADSFKPREARVICETGLRADLIRARGFFCGACLELLNT